MQTHTARPSLERSEESSHASPQGHLEGSPRVNQLRALQGGLDRSPRVQGLSRLGASLNHGAPSAAPPIQRMEWRKQGPGVLPEDTGHVGPAPDPLLIPPTLVEHDIWDDATNNVYDGATGFLKYNHQEPQMEDLRVPEALRQEFDVLNKSPNVSSKNAIKSYHLKLNKFSTQLTEWFSTQDPVSSASDGTEVAVKRLRARIGAIKSRSVLHDQAPIPKIESDRALLALGGASRRLYDPVTAAALGGSGTQDIETIDSSVSDAPTGVTTVDTHEMAPVGTGLDWWASAAMGLRGVAGSAGRGQLLHLPVGTGQVPIGVKEPSKSVPQGEFIVLGHNAPIVHDANPNQQGMRTPSSAAPEHKVSYPAFLTRLTDTQRVHGTDDAVLAQAMLKMVKSPSEDPEGVPPAFLPLLRELLVTWMVAEPARDRSVIFNSVLSLQEIANGSKGFGHMLTDDGLHPMTGGGTAKAGRTAETYEEKLLSGKPAGKASKVEERQKQQLKRLATDGDLSSPLEQVLQDHGIGGQRLRYVPDDTV
ncbi:hypothetical protein LZ198_28120 [Myxococcus sp. K15C18031901]|uniref:hypothetical protein n=1 Tax=Myxococcus dinghuensis TaxID=2906761 RepID=UPI0020A73C78|nr:hypothetical protein [Myxococcus dinghuensis]MCP3102749.1 hypothetical protein [Myxococcus dinghuensis]